jgi:IS30 family transposase
MKTTVSTLAALRLKAQGLSIRESAKVLGVHPAAVQRALRRVKTGALSEADYGRLSGAFLGVFSALKKYRANRSAENYHKLLWKNVQFSDVVLELAK